MDTSLIMTIWILLCVFLAFLVQAGLALVETGFSRAKNAGNTVAMNAAAPAIAALGCWALGFGIQHGSGLFFSDASHALNFLSAAVLTSIALTIPIGAMAERWTFKSFLIFSFFLAMIVYPVQAGWVWNSGWLSNLGRSAGLGHGVLDLAGASVVHLAGGMAGLAGAMVLGPRMGKYRADGRPLAMPGHHLPMAATGALLLLVGWFGFTGMHAALYDGNRAALIAVNTLLSGAAGACAALCYTWSTFGKPELSLTVNGLIGGLVAISASCAFVSPVGAIVIGAVAGVLCCWSVFFIERKLAVDDPAGSISMHAVCGAWGMIALGLFADGSFGGGMNGVTGNVAGLFHGGGSQLVAQVIGVLVASVFVFGVSFVFLKLLNRFAAIRVAEESEFEGLDQNEVSATAYPDFNITKTRR